MAKRGNSEGSLLHRPDGRWEARITLVDGRRKSFYAKTRQDAARRLAEALRDRDKGVPIVPEQQTVERYMTNWLAMVRPTIAPRSFVRYADQVRLHIVPSLGKTRLARLTPQDVQALYARKLDERLSAASVKLIHTVLHHALDDAVRLGLVQRNVTGHADVPRKQRHEMTVLSPDQARMFLRAAADDRLEALYVLALTTGMRQGELLALTWGAIDLDGASLQVRLSLQRVGGMLIFAQPKTAQSRRKIALTAFAVDALRRHRARQLAERLRLGPLWDDHDLVFPNMIGRPADRIDIVRRSLHPLLTKAGLPRMRFHDLRHTAATLLLSQSVHPKVVQEMLGHSQISITLDCYSHVLPDMQRDATAAFERLLGASAIMHG